MAKHTQVSFTGGEWTPTLDARIDLPRYKNSLGLAENMFVHAHGPISNRAGMEFIAEAADSARKARLIPFSFSVDVNQNYALEFGHLVMRVIMNGGLVLNDDDEPYELVTPYTQDDVLSLRFDQSNDVMTFTHKNHKPMELSRLGHDNWQLEEASFVPDVSAPSGLTVVTNGTSGTRKMKYRVAAFDNVTGEESNASSVAEVSNATTNMVNESSFIQINFSGVAGDVNYRIYRWDDADQPLWGLLAEVEETSFKDQGQVLPDSSKSYQISQSPFEDINPSATPTFFKQRRCFAHEQTFYMTQVGNYRNMNISRPVADDDAIIYALSSESSNAIMHLVPMVNDLLAFTKAGVWTISSGNNPFALKFLQVNKQVSTGSSEIAPVVINDTVLMIGADDKSVHDIGYTYEVDKYRGNDLSVMADHLFEGRAIVDRAFQQYPNRILWLAMSDGEMVGMTYMREHNVWGWHRHKTQGFVESVCCVREGGYDALYLLVRRQINGVWKRYIERLHDRAFSAAQEAFFVDCGLTYSGDAVDVLSGLDHLEGCEVSILADGNVEYGKVVSAGSVALDAPSSLVHIGLPYFATIKTLDILAENQALYGALKTVTDATFGFHKTRGGWLGNSLEEMFEIPLRTDESGYDVLDLYSGKIKEPILAISNPDGRIFFQQRDPLPVTITAYELTYDVSE